MRELVNEGRTVLDRPELRGDRDSLDPGDSHAKSLARAFHFREGAEQRGVAFFGLPARGVDLFIGRPASGIESGEQLDRDDPLFRLALDGAAQRPGAACPPAIMVQIGQIEPVAVADGVGFHPPAGVAKRRRDARPVFVANRIKRQPRRLGAQIAKQREQRGAMVASAQKKRPDRKAVPVRQPRQMPRPFDTQRQRRRGAVRCAACIDPALPRKAMRRQQVEPFCPIEGRDEACGARRNIISLIFTVPLHRAALYHLTPNSR